MFVNTECWIQLDPVAVPDKGRSWYCDALAINLKPEPAIVYLVEVSYAQKLGALFTRLAAWNEHWSGVRQALVRDCHLRADWKARPWLFVPSKSIPSVVQRIRRIAGLGEPERMPPPLITPLEMVAPWEYPSWNRAGERVEGKPSTIPPEMRE